MNTRLTKLIVLPKNRACGESVAPVMRDPGSIPRGYLCETGILLLVLSRYIGDPDVIDHCCLVWGLSRTITGLSCWQCDNPIDLTQLFCLGFTLTAGAPSGFTTTESAAGGGEPCGEPAISLHLYTIPLVQWNEGPGFNPQGGTYVKLGFSC